MNAKSIKGTSTEEIGLALTKTLEEGFHPTLAIVFLSVSQNRNAICKIFRDQDISIYGATTNGEFVDEEIGEKSIAVLLLDINTDHFRIYFDEFTQQSPRETTRRIAERASTDLNNPAFLIVGSHMETDGESLLHGFQDEMGNQVDVYGGMAGDDFSFADQFVFTNSQSSNRGVVVVAFDGDRIKITGRAICGWKPMGTMKTVTKSEGNRVYTIDDVPILELTRKFSGLENISKENENVALEIATTFPLQLQRENGPPIMRPGLVVNWEDGSFFCGGTVPQGSKIRFSLPPDFDILDEVVQGCEQLKEQEMPVADAVILFSCGGRLMTFGPLMHKEIEGVYNVWKAPMVGMFSNAEFGKATNGNLELHNLTTCCVALKEV